MGGGSTVSESGKEGREWARFAEKTLLIVDDDLSLREALSVWLADEFPGLRVLQANSGEQAVNLIRGGHGRYWPGEAHGDRTEKGHVDVVLMDLRLPGINGIEATRQIKSGSPDVQVIILSQYGGTEFKAKAEEAGAAAYVLKRQSARELLPVVSQALAAQRRKERADSRDMLN
jgi:CheY-like chemotaxis protein